MTSFIEDDSQEKVFQKVSIPESVVLLLERMELSRGFTSNNFGSTLLPPQNIIQLIVEEKEKENNLDVNSEIDDSRSQRSSQVLWNDTFQPQNYLKESYEESKQDNPRPRYKSIRGQYLEENLDFEYDENDPTK